ncbi:InlB B-repeat-containing protein [Atopobiaceae bacterium 24-176]
MKLRRLSMALVAAVVATVLFLQLAPTVSLARVEDPVFEEGKINLVGEVTLAADKKLVQDLRWSFPFENPLRPGEGIADPGRPYKYVIWQAKRSTGDASWSDWESRSGFGSENKIRVLNVAPNAASTAYLKNWMNMQVTDPATGETVPVSRNIMDIDAITIDQYNASPNSYLMETVANAQGEQIQQYKYDVLMFGTYDANANQDLVAASRDATVAFAQHGGGLMFGHDTVTGSASSTADPFQDTVSKALHHPYFNRFAQSDFLDIFPGQGGVTHNLNHVKVVDTGFLTSRPWDLEGQTLTIPSTHVLGQVVPASSGARVWMQMSDAAGNVSGGQYVPGQTTANYYLVTKGATAMIQTGHSNGQATADEAKVFANTLLYIAQGSRYTSGSDLSFADEDAPTQGSARVSRVELDPVTQRYSAAISLSGSSDLGTQFSYRIQAIPQASLQNAPEYKEIWSTPDTSLEDVPENTSVTQTALSGLRGYYVTLNQVEQATPLASLPAGAQILPSSNAGERATFTTAQNLALDAQYYAHVYAVDWAGNVSADTVVSVKMIKRTAHFHMNENADSSADTLDDFATSLFTDNGVMATYPSDPEREGYRFDGWFANADGTGDQADPDAVYPVPDGKPFDDPMHFFARWVKTWNVSVSQRGPGATSVSADGQQDVPASDRVYTFDTGTQAGVFLEPDTGCEVASVWVDGRLLDAEEYAAGALDLGKLGADRHVVVEYRSAGSATAASWWPVSTKISGATDGCSITKSASVADGTRDHSVEWSVADGSVVEAVYVDGIARPDLVSEGAVTFSHVTAPHEVEVVVATAGSDHRVSAAVKGGPGTVSPTGSVPHGAPRTVRAAVDASYADNYELLTENVHVFDASGRELTAAELAAAGITVSVADDGAVEVGFASVEGDWSVEAVVTPRQQAGVTTVPADELLSIETSVEGEGDVTPSAVVRRGDDREVAWKAAEGWRLKSVTVDASRHFYPETGRPALLSAVRASAGGGVFSADVFRGPVVLRAARDFTGSTLIDDEGTYPFPSVATSHRVHVTFERLAPPLSCDPDSEEAKGSATHRVETSLLTEGPGSITASADSLPKGADYPVSWEVPEGYRVHKVLVNGEERPDLVDKGSVELSDIQSDASVQVLVERDRSGKNGLLVKLDPLSLAAFDYEGVTPGERVLGCLALQNGDEAAAWARNQVAGQTKQFLGWTRDPAAKALVTSNERLDSGYTTIYPVFGALATPGEPSNAPRDPDDPDDPGDPSDPSDPDDPSSPDGPAKGEPVDPADPATTPAGDPTLDREAAGVAFINKVVRNLTAPVGPNRVGDTVRYYLSAQNNRLALWSGVTLTDVLPEGVVPQEGTAVIVTRATDGSAASVEKAPAGWYDAVSCTVSADLGDIAPGINRCLVFECRLTAEAKADDGTPVANGASVLGESDGTLTDPRPDDPTVLPGPAGGLTEDVALPGDGTVRWAAPDISVVKTAENLTAPNAATAKVGDRIAYTVTMETTKEYSAIEDGVLLDTLPEGVEADASTLRLSVLGKDEAVVDPACYDASSRTVRVSVGELLCGQKAQLRFEAVVGAGAVGRSIPNVALGADAGTANGTGPAEPGTPPAEAPADTVASEPAYPNGGADSLVEYAAGDLAVTKSAVNEGGSEEWHIGDVAVYTVTVENPLANSLVSDVVVTDAMGSGLELDRSSLTLVGGDGAQAALDADKVFDPASRRIEVPLGDVAGGTGFTLTYRAKVVEPDRLGSIVNDVVATGSDGVTRGGSSHSVSGSSSVRIPYPVNGRYGRVGAILAKTGDVVAPWLPLLVAGTVAGVLTWRKARG